MLALRLGASRNEEGFSLIELVIGMTVLSVGLLGVASMFSTGYTDVAAGGKTTVAVGMARQIMEDIRLLPAQNSLASVFNLNNVDTTNVGSLPAADPELRVARKFRFLMAGTDQAATWGITTPPTVPAMTDDWGARMNLANTAFTGQGRIDVADVGAVATTLAQVTVTVTITGRPAVVLTSLISRL